MKIKITKHSNYLHLNVTLCAYRQKYRKPVCIREVFNPEVAYAHLIKEGYAISKDLLPFIQVDNKMPSNPLAFSYRVNLSSPKRKTYTLKTNFPKLTESEKISQQVAIIENILAHE
tara:strand:+ start:7258 stop:7605 length:348 start_codon:yes stop_codon:yes gene_type:complete